MRHVGRRLLCVELVKGTTQRDDVLIRVAWRDVRVAVHESAAAVRGEKPEVGDLPLAIHAENVGGLDVAVQEPVAMEGQ